MGNELSSKPEVSESGDMGDNFSDLKNGLNEKLLKKTGFTSTEYQLLKNQFFKMALHSGCDLDNSFSSNQNLKISRIYLGKLFFPEKYSPIFKNINNKNENEGNKFNSHENLILQSIFNAINTDGDGFLSWSEFVIGLSIALKGTFQEKIFLTYNIFDFDNNKSLTKIELKRILTSLKKMKILEPKNLDIDTVLNSFYHDVPPSSGLNFQEFERKSKQYQAFIEGCGIFKFFFAPILQPIKFVLDKADPYSMEGEISLNGKDCYGEIKGGMLLCYNDSSKEKIFRTTSLNSLKRVEYVQTNEDAIVVITSNNTKLVIITDFSYYKEWQLTFCLFSIQQTGNRFNSSYPLRKNVYANWYIDGKDGFAAMSHAIKNAKNEIFIIDWGLNIYIYLERKDGRCCIEDRFDKILEKKAKEGVKIYFLIWKEEKYANMNLSSGIMQGLLHSIHKNIHCVHHPPNFQLFSHHQKCCVVDRKIAFIGGLDFYIGRWDSQQHPLTDIVSKNDFGNKSILYPGPDYSNPCIKKYPAITNKMEMTTDNIDRETQPKMGWHDIHCSVFGGSIIHEDICGNFIGRYNHHRKGGSEAILHIDTTVGDDEDIVHNKDVKYLLRNYDFNHSTFVNAQLLRSICHWSGNSKLEKSIYEAYKKLIDNSKYYIYIENQFFISKQDDQIVENSIAERIYLRIVKAIESKEKFRVYIILPLHPEGNLMSGTTKQVIKYQYQTMWIGENSLIGKLKKNYKNINIDNYISFNYLRNYGFCYDNKPVTEQIYVHSKLMIVDDMKVIIGSANINDRSLNGDRDSEIALVLEDKNFVHSKMNGKKVKVGKFAKSLRMKLWKEHCTNIDLASEKEIIGKISNLKEKVKAHEFYEKADDPISDHTFNLWKKIGKNNVDIYTKVFKNEIPQKCMKTIQQFVNQRKKCRDEWDDLSLNEKNSRFHFAKEQLKKTKGHLCEYPLYWIKNESYPLDLALKTLINPSVFT